MCAGRKQVLLAAETTPIRQDSSRLLGRQLELEPFLGHDSFTLQMLRNGYS